MRAGIILIVLAVMAMRTDAQAVRPVFNHGSANIVWTDTLATPAGKADSVVFTCDAYHNCITLQMNMIDPSPLARVWVTGQMDTGRYFPPTLYNADTLGCIKDMTLYMGSLSGRSPVYQLVLNGKKLGYSKYKIFIVSPSGGGSLTHKMQIFKLTR